MGAWELSLATFSSAEAAEIEKNAISFATTQSGRYIADNLNKEHFLDVSAMREIQALFLVSHPGASLSRLNEYKTTCIRHVLKGGPVRLSAPPVKIGRAVEEKSLVDAIFYSSGRRIPRRALSAIITRLVSGSATSTDLSVIASLHMSQWAVWITWDEVSNGVGDPFNFSKPACADTIRASLGLSMNGIGQRIILLVYPSARTAAMYRPTCADAGLFLRFKPPPLDKDDFGLTKPWEEMPRELKKPGRPRVNRFPPRPEALHEKIQFPPDLIWRSCPSGIRFVP